MAEQLDVRGLSCPLPVIRTKERLASLGAAGTLEVLIDGDTARENVIRLAANLGWRVEELAEGGFWRLVISK